MVKSKLTCGPGFLRKIISPRRRCCFLFVRYSGYCRGYVCGGSLYEQRYRKRPGHFSGIPFICAAFHKDVYKRQALPPVFVLLPLPFQPQFPITAVPAPRLSRVRYLPLWYWTFFYVLTTFIRFYLFWRFDFVPLLYVLWGLTQFLISNQRLLPSFTSFSLLLRSVTGFQIPVLCTARPLGLATKASANR